MFKKTGSFLWGLFVITALVIGQVQTVLAAQAPEVGMSEQEAAVSAPPESENNKAYIPPDPTDEDCVMRINGMLVTDPIPAGWQPNKAAGPRYYGLDTLGTVVDPRYIGAADYTEVKRAVGDTVNWVMLIGNISNGAGCSPVTITQLEGYFSGNGTETQIGLNFTGTPNELAPGDVAWAEVPFTILPNAASPMPIYVWAKGELPGNPRAGLPPNDTIHLDTDHLLVPGPGFEITVLYGDPHSGVASRPGRFQNHCPEHADQHAHHRVYGHGG